MLDTSKQCHGDFTTENNANRARWIYPLLFQLVMSMWRAARAWQTNSVVGFDGNSKQNTHRQCRYVEATVRRIVRTVHAVATHSQSNGNWLGGWIVRLLWVEEWLFDWNRSVQCILVQLIRDWNRWMDETSVGYVKVGGSVCRSGTWRIICECIFAFVGFLLSEVWACLCILNTWLIEIVE